MFNLKWNPSEQIILTTDWHKFRIKYNTSRNLIEKKTNAHLKYSQINHFSQSKSKNMTTNFIATHLHARCSNNKKKPIRQSDYFFIYRAFSNSISDPVIYPIIKNSIDDNNNNNNIFSKNAF